MPDVYFTVSMCVYLWRPACSPSLLSLWSFSSCHRLFVCCCSPPLPLWQRWSLTLTRCGTHLTTHKHAHTLCQLYIRYFRSSTWTWEWGHCDSNTSHGDAASLYNRTLTQIVSWKKKKKHSRIRLDWVGVITQELYSWLCQRTEVKPEKATSSFQK